MNTQQILLAKPNYPSDDSWARNFLLTCCTFGWWAKKYLGTYVTFHRTIILVVPDEESARESKVGFRIAKKKGQGISFNPSRPFPVQSLLTTQLGRVPKQGLLDLLLPVCSVTVP